MTDSVDVIDFKQDTTNAEAALQDWLDNNTVTSIDHTNTYLVGTNRTAMVIWYTS